MPLNRLPNLPLSLRAARVTLVGLLALGLWDCSSTPARVLPGQHGVNRSVALHAERGEAESEAVVAANDYCVGRGRNVTYLRDATAPVGRVGVRRSRFRSEVLFRCD